MLDENNLILIENINPKWTEMHLEHVFKYQIEYGLNLSNDDIQQEITNINEGRPTRRCSVDMRCFEIYVNENHIGDVTLNQIEEDSHEISIAIFDKYSGKGYAKTTMNKFIDIYNQTIGGNLEAIVRNENTKKDQMIYLLSQAGFTFLSNLENGKLFYLKKMS